MGLDCITLTLLSIINTQSTLTLFSPPLNTTNHISVDVKSKERIEIATNKETWSGLLYKTTKISLPTIK